jgi:hypothetical protein
MPQPRALLLFERCYYCGLEGTQQQPHPLMLLTYSRVTQSQLVIRKNKTCSSRWIIRCTPPCAMVVGDRLCDAEAGGQTVTSGCPTTCCHSGRGHHRRRRRWRASTCMHCDSAVSPTSMGARCTTVTSRYSMHC